MKERVFDRIRTSIKPQNKKVIDDLLRVQKRQEQLEAYGFTYDNEDGWWSYGNMVLDTGSIKECSERKWAGIITRIEAGKAQWDELTRLKTKAVTTANSEGTGGMPNREGDNEGQAGVDETKHN